MNSIKRITATAFRLPMTGSLRWGKASVLDEVRHVLVEVELSDGSIGLAEAPPRPQPPPPADRRRATRVPHGRSCR